MPTHYHDLPVCGFGAHMPHAPDCAGMGDMISCGEVVDPAHPQFGRARCEHKPPPPHPPATGDHIHDLPVCGFGTHNPHAPECEGLGPEIACAEIVDSSNPDFGRALCRHLYQEAGSSSSSLSESSVSSSSEGGGSSSSPVESSSATGPTGSSGSAGSLGSNASSGGGTSSSSSSASSSSEAGGGDGGDGGDGAWGWWWRYWWVVPLILLLLILLGLLIDLLEWLGVLAELLATLKALWEALREFLRHRPRWPKKPPDISSSLSSSSSTASSSSTTDSSSPSSSSSVSSSSSYSSSSDSDSAVACVLDGEPVVTFDQSGFVVVDPNAQPGTVRVGQAFSVEAHFTGECRCCEYRQEIKGYAWVRRRGSPGYVDIGMEIGGGAQLARDDFQEDGKRWFRYGHRRGQSNIFEDSYLPDRPTGCTYKGSDLPNINGLSLGDSVDLHLTFRGRIVDVCTGAVKWEKIWRIHGYGFVDIEMSFPYLTSTYKFTPL